MKKETKTPSEQEQTNAKDNRYDLRELPLSQHLDRLWSRTHHANQHFVNDGEQGSRISEFES